MIRRVGTIQQERFYNLGQNILELSVFYSIFKTAGKTTIKVFVYQVFVLCKHHAHIGRICSKNLWLDFGI